MHDNLYKNFRIKKKIYRQMYFVLIFFRCDVIETIVQEILDRSLKIIKLSR